MADMIAAKRGTKIIDYPTSDGRPMSETDYHRDVLINSIGTLNYRYRHDDNVYVSGNMLMFYVPGNKRKHVSPDVFVVFGVPKKPRDNYLIWEEGKSPDVIVEATSKTTAREDIGKKELYRVVLKVKEYFLFDPTADYLDPRLQGFRLSRELYKPIRMVSGRLPSKQSGIASRSRRRQPSFLRSGDAELPSNAGRKSGSRRATGRTRKTTGRLP